MRLSGTVSQTTIAGIIAYLFSSDQMLCIKFFVLIFIVNAKGCFYEFLTHIVGSKKTARTSSFLQSFDLSAPSLRNGFLINVVWKKRFILGLEAVMLHHVDYSAFSFQVKDRFYAEISAERPHIENIRCLG